MASTPTPPLSFPKVYLVAEHADIAGGGYIAYALAEDGTALGSHFSSTRGYAALDLSTREFLDRYSQHFGGKAVNIVNLLDLDDPSEDPGYAAALALNRANPDNGPEVSA
jgi:hypothetical protein